MSRIKICRDLRTFFGDLWAKKVPFWVKTVLLGQEVHYYMVYIAYFTELNSKFEITRKNDAFVAKIVNTRLTKGFMAIFAPAESLPSPATLCIIGRLTRGRGGC